MNIRVASFSFLLVALAASEGRAEDVGSAAARGTDASLAAPPAEAPRHASIPAELAVSMGTTMVLSPAVYSGARLLGGATPNLATSAVPALLLAAALPPAIAAGFLSWERHREGARARFLAPYLYGLGAQVLVLAGSFLAHTYVADPKDLVLLSAVSGVACGGFATLGAEIHFR
jgi:hypothetical protein